MEKDIQDLIDKEFRDNSTIWFDYVDYIKVNNDVQRKGLKYIKKGGRFEIYIVSEDGEEIILDALRYDESYKLENILKIFRQ
jgi:hypothetical protein